MVAQYSSDYLAELEREERERREDAAAARWVNLGFRIRDLRAGLARIWASNDPDVWSLAPAFCRDIARLTSERARLLELPEPVPGERSSLMATVYSVA